MGCFKICTMCLDQSIYCMWICVLIINVQVKLLHCYVNDFVSFSGIGIELGNLSGHRTLITFCKLIANCMYITLKFSWLFSQHGQGKWNFESGKSQGIFKVSMSGNPESGYNWWSNDWHFTSPCKLEADQNQTILH